MVLVRKLDHAGREKARYIGHVLERGIHAVVIQTAWQRAAMDLGFVTLEPEDRWREYFYDDRWYNIFEIRTKELQLKGWYCNITRPARITGTTVDWEDLALDLWVEPDGTASVLDEDEFECLTLPLMEREEALCALAELRRMVSQRHGPFDRIDRGGLTEAGDSVPIGSQDWR